MDRFIERCLRGWNDFMTRLKARNWKTWAAVALVVFTLGAVVSNRYANFMDPAFTAAGKIILGALKAPLWAGGGLLLAWIIVLITLAYWETRPKLSAAVARADESLAAANNAHANIEKERDEATANVDALLWRLRFGMSRPSITDDPRPDFQKHFFDASRVEIEKLRPAIRATWSPLSELVGTLITTQVNAGVAGQWAVDLFYEFPRRRAWALFEAIDQPGREDIRVVLVAFYEKYNELRDWILAVHTGTAPFDLPDISKYCEWLEADRAFFDRLETALSISALADVKREIGYARDKHKWPSAMPAPKTLTLPWPPNATVATATLTFVGGADALGERVPVVPPATLSPEARRLFDSASATPDPSPSDRDRDGRQD